MNFLILSGLLAGMWLCGPPPAFSQAAVIQVGDPDLIATTLTSWLDAGHVKVGQVYSARMNSSWVLEGCTIRADTLLKLRIEAATKHAKATKESTMALSIDPVRCVEKTRPPMTLKLVAIVAADYETGQHLLQSTPVEVVSRGKQIDNVDEGVQRMSAHIDHDANTARVRPGQVLGFRHLTLQLEGGPRESTVLTDSERNVSLGSNTRLMVTEMYRKPASTGISPEK